MADQVQLLTAMRFGDSAFPSGGFAFSSGLEGAHRDGWIDDGSDVAAFVAEQLADRWHRCDRVLLCRAWSAPDPVAVDALAEAHAVMSVLRQASRRAGAGLLSTFAAVPATAADERFRRYRDRARAGTTPGHLPVVQAVALRSAGLSLTAAEAIAAWQVVSGITGAALRLGICGHLGAQRVIERAIPLARDLLSRPAPQTPSAFTAFADIAAQRRDGDVRLFAS